jgi:hypothetical protein
MHTPEIETPTHVSYCVTELSAANIRDACRTIPGVRTDPWSCNTSFPDLLYLPVSAILGRLYDDSFAEQRRYRYKRFYEYTSLYRALTLCCTSHVGCRHTLHATTWPMNACCKYPAWKPPGQPSSAHRSAAIPVSRFGTRAQGTAAGSATLTQTMKPPAWTSASRAG